MVNTYVWCSEQKASNLALEGRDRRVPGNVRPVIRVESERPRANKKPCLKSQDRVPTPTSQSTQTHTRKRKMTKLWGRMNTMGWVWGRGRPTLVKGENVYLTHYKRSIPLQTYTQCSYINAPKLKEGGNRVTPKFVPEGLGMGGNNEKFWNGGKGLQQHTVYTTNPLNRFITVFHIYNIDLFFLTMLTVLWDCFILVFIAIDIKAVSYVHVKVNMLKTTTKIHLQGLPHSRLSVPSSGVMSEAKLQSQTPQTHGCRDFVPEKCLALTKSKLTETQI